MKLPIQISFRNLGPSGSIEAAIRIDLTVPGREIAIAHKGPQDHARRGRGEVKTHHLPGAVAALGKHRLVG